MALNIKNPEAHRLAQELAEATGSNLTEAVTEALRESLQSHREKDSFEVLWAEVVELQRFVADLPDRDARPPDEILGYDDQGLPQ